MSAQHTPGPWASLSYAERARAYQDASLRLHNIDWYQFHGIDPRDTTANAVDAEWLSSRLREAAIRVAKATGAAA